MPKIVRRKSRIYGSSTQSLDVNRVEIRHLHGLKKILVILENDSVARVLSAASFTLGVLVEDGMNWGLLRRGAHERRGQLHFFQ